LLREARDQIERDTRELESRYGADDPRVAKGRLLLRFLEAFSALPPDQRRLLPTVREATRLDGESEELFGKGEYRRAYDTARAALSARDRLPEGVRELHPQYPATLLNLALAAIRLDRVPEATGALTRGRALLARTGRRSDPLYALDCHNLAYLAAETGRLREADSLQTEAVHLFGQSQAGTDADTYVEMLLLSGRIREDLGDHARATEPLETARRVLGGRNQDRSETYARVLNNLAAQYHLSGNYEAAEPLYQEALALKRDLYGPEHPTYLLTLNNLGKLYLQMQDVERGRPLILEAYRILTGLPRAEESAPDVCRVVQINRAQLHHQDGETDQAVALYEKARGSLSGRERNRHRYDVIKGLANVLTDRGGPGDRQRAEGLYLGLIGELERAGLASGPDYAELLNALAVLYDLTSDQPKARAALGKALAAAGTDLSQRSVCLHNLGMFFAKAGETAEAERLTHEGLAAREALCDIALPSLNGRQRVDLLSGYRYALDDYLSVAVEVAPADRVYGHFIRWKGWALAGGAGGARLPHPDLTPLRDRLRSARRAYAAGAHPGSLPGGPPGWPSGQESLRRQKDEAESLLALQTSRVVRGLALAAAANLVASPFAPGGATAGVVAQHFSSAGVSRLDPAGPAPPLTPEWLTRRMPPSVVFLDYLRYDHRGEDRYVVAALTAGRGPVLVPLGAAKPIDDAVWELRDRLAARDQAGLKRARETLSEKLWPPPLRRLVGDAGTVLLSPDGALHFLPFAVLTGEKQEYLVQEKALGYVGSARQLLAALSPPECPAGAGVLAVGGIPDVGPAGLPESGPEAEGVCGLFRAAFPDKRRPLLLGEEATKDRVLRELGGGWRFVHLAVHGFTVPGPEPVPARGQPARPARGWGFVRRQDAGSFGEDSLARFGLAFRGAADWPGKGNGVKRPDGWFVNPSAAVSALELLDFDLRGVELVVLSACRTGDGDLVAGEGMYSLTRAFQAAGARSVVASLWPVDDAATRALMQEFYRNLWQEKKGKLEALHMAQLAMLREYDPAKGRLPPVAERPRGVGGTRPAGPAGAAGASPFYWAAFSLSGDWR
jgi:CHAT domain-containing protein/tetratricopeptide (TPR) repeat protein